MRRAVLLLAVVLVLPSAALAATPRTTLPDVEDEVMCITCGTVLSISQAPSAERERAFIRRRIAEGLTKAQIKQRLLAEYGPKVLAEPHQAASWLIPVLLGAAAVASIGFTVRRWRQSSRFVASGPDIDPVANTRLDRDMASYDL